MNVSKIAEVANEKREHKPIVGRTCDTQISSDSSTTNSSSNGSSEASESNSTTSSQTTTNTSSSSSSSASTRKVLTTQRLILEQIDNRNKDNMHADDSGSASEAQATGSNGLVQTHSTKRYKNSPFGLKRHYLTMPEADQTAMAKISSIGIGHGGADDSDDSEPLGSPNIAHNRVTLHSGGKHEEVTDFGRNKSKTKRKNSASPSESYGDAAPTSSSSSVDGLSPNGLASSDMSALGAWPAHYGRSQMSSHHHHHHHHQLTPTEMVTSQPKHHRHHQPSHLVGTYSHPLSDHGAFARSQMGQLTPASDAGLDAPKCNAKDAEAANCLFQQKASSHDHLHQVGAADGGKQSANVWAAHQQQESSGLLVRFSSIMYATFLVILGCILHVSELRQKSKNSSDHIYTTIVALIGIIWLFFLQMDLQRYKRYASKYILIETIFNDRRQKRRESAQTLGLDPSARSTTSSSASLVNDRMSMNTEVIFKKTAYKMYQRRAAMNHRHHRERAPSKLSQLSGHSDVYKLAAPSLKSSLASPTGSDGDVGGLLGNEQHLVPAYKFLHGKMGANFYLKCGMAAFCFGHVIHEGLRFGQQVYFFGAGNLHCRDSAALVAHLVTPLYSFYQLFMMFKYSNLVINRHKVLASFGLMHIIGTSVTFWFRTIMEEAFEDFVHKMDYFKTNKPQMNLAMAASESDSNIASLLNSIGNAIKLEATERSDWSFVAPTTTDTLQPTSNNLSIAQSLLTLMSSPISATITPQIVRHLPDSYACAQNTLLTTKSMNALPYLYPFTIEYNLLLAATFLSLYFNIGKIGLPKDSSSSNCKPSLIGSSLGGYSSGNTKQGSLCSGPGSYVELSDNSSAAVRMSTRGYGDKEAGEYKSNFVVNADCHSANKGLFCGFFVLLVTLVTIVIFFVTINKPTHIQLGIKINLIQEATLTALILIVTLAGFKQVVKLNRNPYLKDKVTTDDVLMLVPLPFFFIHSLLSFRAETASMSPGSISSSLSSILLQGNRPEDSVTTPSRNLQSILLSANDNNTQIVQSKSRLNNLLAGHPNGTNGRFVEDFISYTNNSNSRGNRNGRNISSIDSGSNSQIDHFKLITVALNIIVMIEVLVQTNFIIDGMRRCSESRYLRFKKPGRELITFAILLNITYWIVATFETKSVEQYKTEIEYYGPLPYMFISHTTLPVMLFYRYHSSVCLAEIWNRAYKPPKKR